MTYQETINYLYKMLPMYQREGKVAFKKDLTNIEKLCAYLHNPQIAYPVLHIGGTNGKGSVTHLLAAALQNNGYNVGIYSSPHYRDFRERIKINGTLISEDDVIDFVDRMKDAIEAVKPSFFEISVAMAFDYFKNQAVDFAVIEVGLGGSFDSTNIVHPMLSVITNISYDHQSILGDTLPEIAASKAGIIKYGVPVVIGSYNNEVHHVFEKKALQQNSPLFIADEEVAITTYGRCSVRGEKCPKAITFDKDNPFLVENLKTALLGLDILSDQVDLHPDKTIEGLENFQSLTNYIGRMQTLGEKPRILVDSAHNTAAIKRLMAYLSTKSFSTLHIVFGMVNDKDIDPVLALLPKEANYYFCKANIPRGLAALQLEEKAAEHELHGTSYDSVAAAYEAAQQNASEDDFILVCGSIFVVAEII